MLKRANETQPVVVEKQIRTKRRRKLIIDDVKEIDSATMKSQLSDTGAILGSLEMAPPTRKLMQWKENGGVDRLFVMTSRPLYSKALQKLYTRNMVTKSLADITNSAKSLADKTGGKDSGNNAVTNILLASMSNDIEAMRDGNMSKNVLPSADSYIDDNNDNSKRHPLDDMSLDPNLLEQPNNFDDFDQLGGPASIFNSNHNLEDMLLDDIRNLEETPGKHDHNKSKKVDEEGESDEDEDEEDDENRKSMQNGKNVSPNTSQKKRHYRKSTNTSNKENTTIKDDDDLLDDTLTNDPNKHLNKRAKTMVSILNKNFNKNDNVGFFELTKRNGRKNLAQKFYSLLVLKKYEIIDLSQDEHYGDIIISKGDKFDTFAPS